MKLEVQFVKRDENHAINALYFKLLFSFVFRPGLSKMQKETKIHPLAVFSYY
jgi:hypothetical protein